MNFQNKLIYVSGNITAPDLTGLSFELFKA